MDILAGFEKITTFMFDVDGVLTDGGILVLENGDMARYMNTKDGYALQLAVKRGYGVYVITGSSKSAVERRLNNLGVKNIFFQVGDKRTTVLRIMKENQLDQNEVLFMGDDVPDMATFDVVGLGACPADAVADVRAKAHYISDKNGGRGCARDVIEKVLKCRGDWGPDHTIKSM